MAGAYSADLRERVVEAINEGTARRAAGRIFKVSASTAVRWAQRFRDTGTSAAKRSGGDLRSRGVEAHKDWLLALVAKEPDLTLAEIRTRLAVDQAFKTSLSALWRFDQRHRISLKKPAPRRTGPQRRQSRPRGLARAAALD